jgi:hypothetical protein
MGWVLTALVQKNKYAFATDRKLADLTRMPLNKAKDTLTALANGGAIVRLHKPNGGQFMRLIYLAKPPFVPVE